MNTPIRMSSAAPVREFGPASPPSAGPRPSLGQLATMLEVLAVYSGILLYIWRWQAAHPRAWMALLAVILLSHVAHRDTLRKLGLSLAELRSSAEFVLPVIALVYVPLAILGF